MSRIGKKEIILPEQVKVTLQDCRKIVVEGPKGSLNWTFPEGIDVIVEAQVLRVECLASTRKSRAFHGLTRALIANMVTGVFSGIKRALEIHGVGFKAALQGNQLNLSLGYSHPILLTVPEGIKVTVTDNTKLLVEGIDKQLVGQFAANIRSYYPPEPYKGKGIRYEGEIIRQKEGKTVQ